MIFCRRCGRYSSDGTSACACGANLETFGHASFKATPVKAATISTTPEPVRSAPRPAPRPASRPVPRPTPAATPVLAVTPSAVATAVLEPPAELELVPPASPSPSHEEEFTRTETEPVFDRDKFLLRQKALAIKEKYYVTDDSGSPLMFVERPALLTQQLIMLAAVAVTFFGGSFVMAFITGFVGPVIGRRQTAMVSGAGFLVVLLLTGLAFLALVPKRHVTFYKDDTRTDKILEIQQLNKIEFPYANFNILDAAGNLIGTLRKNVLFDYVRRRWEVLNANGLPLCMAKEDSIILSLLRRTRIPIFLLLRTNFIFLRGKNVIGEFNRKLTLLDRYVLDLTADPQRTFDRRIAIALGVMLDTGEHR